MADTVYLPSPHHFAQPKFDVSVSNEVDHHADLLFLLHDWLPRGDSLQIRIACGIFEDFVVSRSKETEALTSKESTEVASSLSHIYKHGPLKLPKHLQVDPGSEFMGSVSQTVAKHSHNQARRERIA